MKEKTQNLIQKQPVVVILGHIDAGKTSLLNAIRQIEFTERKPGGQITQAIGAFEVEKDGKRITFLDTPGHEAFSQMRSRGAKVADIAILVVDSVEGVKEQTKEAIFHVQKAKIPLIVAFHKIDKIQASPEMAKRELAKEGVLVESMGGKTPEVLTSAKTGQGIEDLLDLILLVWEMEGQKVDVSKPAKGVIIESYLDSKRGPAATLIVEEGVLKVNQIIGTSSTFGKVKILENYKGEKIKEVFPGQPAQVIGFEKVPMVGENFETFSTIEEAQSNIKIFEKKEERERLEEKPGQKILNLILKVDTLGSKEAIEEILKNLPQNKVLIKILKSETGEISEGDIESAKSFKAIIFGFRVKISRIAREIAQRERIKIFLFDLIYDLVEGTRKLMTQILEPEIQRVDLGKVKVLVCFWKKGKRQIVGGRVIEGEVKKGTMIEILRNGEIIGKGKLLNLQKEKKDIEKAKKGEEIGILYEGEERIKEEDTLIIFSQEKKEVQI
jgi:translation initiation factor IF-2